MVSLLRRAAVGFGQGLAQVGNEKLKEEMQKARDARLAAEADKRTAQQNAREDARNAILDDRYTQAAKQNQANFEASLQAKKDAAANALKISENQSKTKAANKGADERRKIIASINKLQLGYADDFNKSVQDAQKKVLDGEWDKSQYDAAVKAAQTHRDSSIAMLQQTYPSYFAPKESKPQSDNPPLPPQNQSPEPSNFVMQSSGNGAAPVSQGLLGSVVSQPTQPAQPNTAATAQNTAPAQHIPYGAALVDKINNYKVLSQKLPKSQYLGQLMRDNSIPPDVRDKLLNLDFSTQ